MESESALRLLEAEAVDAGPLSTVPLAAPEKSESLIAFAYSWIRRSRGRLWPTARSVEISASGLGGAAGAAAAPQSEPTSKERTRAIVSRQSQGRCLF